MGKNWDKTLPPKDVWKQVLRVMKPGTFAFIMATPRQDLLSRLIIQLENVGFITGFTSIYWTYSSGFPKSTNTSKIIDKRLNVFDKKKIVGNSINSVNSNSGSNIYEMNNPKKNGLKKEYDLTDLTEPYSIQAKKMKGSYLGFQPKPALEPIIVVMAPLTKKSYIEQVLENGKGVTWLDDIRIPVKNDDKIDDMTGKKRGGECGIGNILNNSIINNPPHNNGRFPANLLVSDNILDQNIITKARNGFRKASYQPKSYHTNTPRNEKEIDRFISDFKDKGDFSRYFDIDYWFQERIKKYMPKTFPFLYIPKPSKKEKNIGLNGTPIPSKRPSGIAYNKYSSIHRDLENKKNIKPETSINIHPTVKPLKISSYLTILSTRKGNTVLDPFMGSGSFGLAALLLNRKFIGIEMNQDYYKIAQNRFNALSEYKRDIDYKPRELIFQKNKKRKLTEFFKNGS